jgi:ParB-like chromosome segregation protein Spo0J
MTTGPSQSQSEVAPSELMEGLACLRLSSPAALRDMERSLARAGQATAIMVNRTESGLQVVDGFKRLYACRTLGWTTVKVQIEELDSAAAKLRLWQSNSGQGLTEIEEAWVIRALYRDDHLNQPQIAQLMQRHKSWVCRRLMLAEGLSDELSAGVRLGLVSATVGGVVVRLPRGNQDEVARVVAKRGLTSRQTMRLVDDWLATDDPQARQKVLSLANKRAPASAPRTRGRTPGEVLVHDVLATRNLAARLHARLLERALSALGQEAATLAAQELDELVRTLAALQQTIARRLAAHARGGLHDQEHV